MVKITSDKGVSEGELKGTAIEILADSIGVIYSLEKQILKTLGKDAEEVFLKTLKYALAEDLEGEE